MATPAGQIGLSDVNTELGNSSTAQINMNNASLRSLAGVPSGQISMSDPQGKSNEIQLIGQSAELTRAAGTTTYPLPAGSQEGDWAIMYVGRPFDTVSVTGATLIGNLTPSGSSFNHYAYYKVLTSTDISNGYLSYNSSVRTIQFCIGIFRPASSVSNITIDNTDPASASTSTSGGNLAMIVGIYDTSTAVGTQTASGRILYSTSSVSATAINSLQGICSFILNK